MRLPTDVLCHLPCLSVDLMVGYTARRAYTPLLLVAFKIAGYT